MCGGGKGVQQTSQQVAYPSLPAASAYSSAMDRISQATSQPFQKYSSDPEAYVASLTPTQRGAISNVSGLAGMTQPYYQTAGAMTLAGAAPVSRLSSGQIQEYMSPYMSQVVDPVQNALRQQFGMQQAQQQAQAIKSGAFGGERAGVERALLRGQQGLALGQALSPLYQTGYGQALQTAQGQQAVDAANLQRMLGAGAQVGGLGTAAQQAALQQASAQLQAGTLEQQTETAQKQALYNEFQKQRMYPLQTAQLYAQAAGGLGPLMGSTSMGYQQMPFFGGFAADGGAIHGYDEGLGGARMGGAVDEAGDYSRGGYADGGYAYGGDAGFESIVAQHRAGIMPHMEDVAFPTADIRPAQQLEARLPESRASSGGLGSMFTKGAELGKLGLQVREARKSHPESWMDTLGAVATGKAAGGDVHSDAMQDLLSNPIQTAKPQQPQQAPQQQKSGLGGLLKAGAGLAANYFMPGSGPLVSAGLGAMGMADGGRAGYQDGGPSEDDFFKRGIQGAESAHRQFDKYGRTLTSPKGAEGISQIMPGTGPEAAKLAGLPYDRQRLRTDEEYNTALGNAYYNKQLKDFGTEELAAAAYNAGPGRVRQALARAEREGGDVMSYLPAETRKYVPTVMRKAGLSQDAIGENIAGLSPRDRSMMALYPEAKSAPAGVVPGERGIGSGQVSDKGFLERVEEKPERLIIPILQGLGAMVGSKNRYALGALAEGLGAGAGSYMDMQQKEADILKRRQEAATEAEETRKRAASVGVEEAATGLAGAQTLETLQKAKNLGFQNFGSAENPNWWATLADGSMKPLYEWSDSQEPLAGGSAAAELANQLYRGMRVSPGAMQPAESADAITQPTTKSVTSKVAEPQKITPIPGVIFDEDSRNAASAELKNLQRSADQPQVRQTSRDYIAGVNQDAQSANQQRIFYNEMADIVSKAATGKLLAAPGPGYEFTSNVIGALNRAVRAIPGLKVGENFFGNAKEYNDVMKKLTTLQAQARAQGAGQKAVGALIENLEALPSLDKEPGAAAQVASQNMVTNQKALDRKLHADQWGAYSRGIYSGSMNDFEKKNDSSKYAQEQDAIRRMLLDTGDKEQRIAPGYAMFEMMKRGSIRPEDIDEYFEKRFNIPRSNNMSRYFVGAR